MPTLRRDDGVQFVTQSYREALHTKRVSAMKREIRTLAKNHGEFVRCYKQEDGRMEVVFSREPGFLLGEAVWNHFERPRDLIYCESLNDRHHALVVIVRAGSVYLDAKVVYSDLIDELAALSANNEKYVIYVHGDVPLSDAGEHGIFAFDAERVHTFERLAEPVFAKLPLDSEFKLQPLELALTGANFSHPLSILFFLGAVFLFFSLSFWYWHAKNAATEAVVAQEVIDPYAAYYKALTTPDPGEQVKEMVFIVSRTYSLLGWKLNSIDYKNDKYVGKLDGMIDDKKMLDLWARLHGFELGSYDKKNNQFVMTAYSKLSKRSKPKNIYNLQQVTELFSSKLKWMLVNENLSVTRRDVNGDTVQSIDATIDFHDFSPDGFLMLGRILNDFPLEIKEIALDTKEGLVSGKIMLTLWGSG